MLGENTPDERDVRLDARVVVDRDKKDCSAILETEYFSGLPGLVTKTEEDSSEVDGASGSK